MKFLSKRANSLVLKQDLRYEENKAANNKVLLEVLLAEQFNFCAYTEEYVKTSSSPEVEHFNPRNKYADDYYNYYVVLRSANLQKKRKEKKYLDATFFDSLFFQKEFHERIRFIVDDLIYEEVDPNDQEAKDFIDYLDLNDHDQWQLRKNHLERLVKFFEKDGLLIHFRKYPEELNYITAIEARFGIDLSEFYSESANSTTTGK